MAVIIYIGVMWYNRLGCVWLKLWRKKTWMKRWDWWKCRRIHSTLLLNTDGLYSDTLRPIQLHFTLFK